MTGGTAAARAMLARAREAAGDGDIAAEEAGAGAVAAGVDGKIAAREDAGVAGVAGVAAAAAAGDAVARGVCGADGLLLNRPLKLLRSESDSGVAGAPLMLLLPFDTPATLARFAAATAEGDRGVDAGERGLVAACGSSSSEALAPNRLTSPSFTWNHTGNVNELSFV